MTEPGALAAKFARLPPDIGSLNRIVQGLLLHSEWLSAYGLDPATVHINSRATLPVSERLSTLIEADERPLREARAPAQRSIGTCRDFALTLCSFLRAKSCAARLRCGFASYFNEHWEDHWVCEYWDEQTKTWRLSDPQLDEITRAGRPITFDPSDMPRDVFLTAGEAWLRCRTGSESADRFGHGEAKGLWFVMVNVVRDAYACNNREASAWDRWREAPEERRKLLPEELGWLDDLASHPESSLGDITPRWLLANETRLSQFRTFKQSTTSILSLYQSA